MSVFYKVIPRKKPGDPEGPVKYYAMQKMTGQATLNDVCDYIAPRAGRSSGSVKTIIEDCATAIAESLASGETVTLDGFASFKVTYKGKGSPTVEEFTPALIERINVRMRPKKNLKNAAEQGVKLISVHTLATQDTSTGNQEDTGI
jgi:predicted histone-like DNA-binding protein